MRPLRAGARPANSLRALALSAGVMLAGCGNVSVPALGPAMTVVESDASHPTVTVGPTDGAIYVAWVGTRDGVSNVYLSRSDDGRAFFAPVRVNDLPGDAAPHEQAPAQVAVGPEGHVYVVWQNTTYVPGRRFPASDLRFARSTDGGRSFEPAITVNDDAGGLPASHTFHDIAVAADGTVYVSWIDSRVRARIEATMAASRAAEHDRLDNGRDADEPPGPEIRVAASRDGGRSFSPSVVVDDDACPCCRTSIATAPDGTLYVAWRKVFEGSVRDVVVARSHDGARSFDEPVRVHDDGWVFEACPHAGPSVAVDEGGRLHVAWYTGREGRQGLYHTVSTDGGMSFGEPAAVVTDAWVPPSLVRLASGPDRTMRLAWDDRRGEVKVVRTALVGPGSTIQPFRGGDSPGISPSMASRGETWAVAWLDEGAVRVRVGRGGG